MPARIERIRGALDVLLLSELTGIKKSTIYDMVNEKRIPHFRIGTAIRFDPHVTAEWLRSMMVDAA